MKENLFMMVQCRPVPLERRPISSHKTLINNTQPTDESAGIVASKIRQLGKGLEFLTTIKKVKEGDSRVIE